MNKYREETMTPHLKHHVYSACHLLPAITYTISLSCLTESNHLIQS